jgi:hypothetical protein
MRFHILLFHYEQLEQQLIRSTATVAALTEKKTETGSLIWFCSFKVKRELSVSDSCWNLCFQTSLDST